MPSATPTDLTTDDLAFDLPGDLIAQRPAPQRGGSRLMVLDAGMGVPRSIGRFDSTFLDQLRDDDLVVANDARVIHARIPIRRVTGGGGELLLLAPASNQAGIDSGESRWVAMARPARKLAAGPVTARRTGDDPATARSIRIETRLDAQTFSVVLPVTLDVVPAWLRDVGELPLPPYITDRSHDDDRYQTVHARVDGAVAAPTAGLHFDDDMWRRVSDRCEVARVTLHVGAGTFLPVQDGPLASHVMHDERYEVSDVADAAIQRARTERRRVVAVGTTTTRVLEHVYAEPSTAQSRLRGSTDMFIVPGHTWACVGALLTNFHLPRSTLIALVMAFHGMDATRESYAYAIEQRMRFYSFGDAMFIHGPPVGGHTR